MIRLTDRPALPKLGRRLPKGVLLNLAAFTTTAVVLTAVWALTGGGGFWPLPILLVWAIGVALHAFGARLSNDDPRGGDLERQLRASRRQ